MQANRNYQSELVKVKSLTEQLTEQIELVTRDKHRLQGTLPSGLPREENVRIAVRSLQTRWTSC